MLTQDINKPNCCEKWEAKPNKILTGLLPVRKKKYQEKKLKWFRMRLVHKKLDHNVVLKHMGIKNDSNCSFCRKERDTVSHLF